MAIPKHFLDALPFSQRAPDIAEADDIFGFLIGSWELDAVLHNADGQRQRSKGEVHATWVLEGRAIQDLFIFPRRADRPSGVPARGDRYATTIRTFDRTLGAWRVHFINPADEETSAQLIRPGGAIPGILYAKGYPAFDSSSFCTLRAPRLSARSRWNVVV